MVTLPNYPSIIGDPNSHYQIDSLKLFVLAVNKSVKFRSEPVAVGWYAAM